MSPQLMEVTNLGKTLGGHKVLDVSKLELRHGETLSLLGPSGSGKTTLLRLCAGLDIPDHGAIRFEGVDMTRAGPEKRPVNMVFQSYALFPHMCVSDNIAYGPKVAGLPDNEARKRCAEVAELVQLTGFGDRRPHQLSGGQQQRVALARALAMRPKALLLDEPLSALDKHLRGQVRDHLCELQQTLGISYLLVTHDQSEALAISQRLALIHDGKLVQVGTPDDIYDRPRTLQAARQLGNMTFIKANGASPNSLHRSAVESLASRGIHADEGCTFGIRPEQVRLVPLDADGAFGIDAVVERVEFGGDAVKATLSCSDGTKMIASKQRNETPKAGDKVRASIDIEMMHVFDSDGETANGT